MEEALKDKRFSHILTDPRFRKMPKNIRKVTVDKRFKGMFKDKKFKGKCMFDKRGRPLDFKPSENLKQLYDISSDSSEDNYNDEVKKGNEKEIPITEPLLSKKPVKLSKLSLGTQIGALMKSGNDDSEDKQSKKISKNKVKAKIVNVNEKKKKKSSESLLSKKSVQLSKSSYDAEIEHVSDESNDKYEQSKNNRKDKKKFNKMNASEKMKKSLYKSKSWVKAISGKQEELPSEDYSDVNILQNERSPIKISYKATQKESVLLKETNSAVENYSNEKVNNSGQISEDEESGSSDEASDKVSSEESDDSDDSDDSSGDISDDFDHQWEELRNEAPDTNEITRRIAVCNMDWDRIRADDLFACFNSFKPADGSITSVKIYPSEFGLKRMEEERVRGPSELVEETLPLNKEEPEDKKGSKYHREKLRQYQINRLKYFYAVVDCDSPETANAVYEQLNGMEYESSSIRFDLRFIPDDVTFEHEPTSTADKVPDPTEYKPRLFVTAALQQVKVNLTWDETDPKRRETLQKAFTEPESIENDLKEYLASSSGESEEDENVEEASKEKLSSKERIAKYKELLLSLEEKEKVEENEYEMEITWEPGLKEKTEEIVKEKMKKDNLNPFEEVIQKKKDERKLKKKEQKAKQIQASGDPASSDDDSDEEFFSKSTSESKVKDHDSKRLAELALISNSKKETHFVEKSNKKKKKFNKKNKPQKEGDFKIDVNDPRFSAIYSNHLFNIDPSDPHFKDSEGNRALIQEKQRKLKSTGFQDRNTKKARYS